MGVLRSVVWVVVVGCSAAAEPVSAPGGECRPSATSSSALQLVGIGPTVVPLHGGDVELQFEGAMPREAVYVNGIAAVLDGTTLHVPATVHGNGPLSIRVGDDPTAPVATLDCAGHYASEPDSVSLA